MEKPRKFIHFDTRETMEVIVIGRTAIPFAVIWGVLISTGIGFLIWGLVGGVWAPLFWLLGICAGVVVLLLIGAVIAVGVYAIIDVNGPQYRGGLTDEKK